MKPTILVLGLAAAANAHVGAFTTGMYCRGGNDLASDNQNTNLVVNPLYNMKKAQWWMQADRGCDKVPPPEGEFLDLPAGGSFTAELAINRAFTSLSYNGDFTSDWPDGLDHPEDWSGPDAQSCLMDNPDGEGGPLHTKSEEASAGTAWAISYAEDLASVSMENLVVFSVLEHTPWKRLATYDVPADLPACPEQGCYCAWLWIPDGCGEPNMYMQNFRCRVTNATSTRSLGTAQIPVPCKDDPSACVSGPKQMIVWNQAEGNNVGDIGFSPAYNYKLGFLPGAQNDIFVGSDESEAPSNVPESSPSSILTSSAATSAAPTPTPSVVSDVSPAATSQAVKTSSIVVSTIPQPAGTKTSEEAPGSTQCKSKKLRRRHRHARRHGGVLH